MVNKTTNVTLSLLKRLSKRSQNATKSLRQAQSDTVNETKHKFIGRHQQKQQNNKPIVTHISYFYITMASKVMTTPTITIIIPTFNAQTTLETALDSIVKQTYSHWEVLIMDGLLIKNNIVFIE